MERGPDAALRTAKGVNRATGGTDGLTLVTPYIDRTYTGHTGEVNSYFILTRTV